MPEKTNQTDPKEHRTHIRDMLGAAAFMAIALCTLYTLEASIAKKDWTYAAIGFPLIAIGTVAIVRALKRWDEKR